MRLRSTGEWQRYVKISFKFCSQKNAIDIFQLPCKRVVFKCKNCAFKLFLSVYFNRVWDRRPLRSWRTKKSRRLSTAVYRQTDRTGDYTVDFNLNLFNFIIWNVSMYWDGTKMQLMDSKWYFFWEFCACCISVWDCTLKIALCTFWN